MVEFFSHSIPFLRVTLNDHLKQVVTDIISILSNPPSTNVPSLLAGEDTNQALYEIAKLLKRVETIPDIVEEQRIDTIAPRVVKQPVNKSVLPVDITPYIIPYTEEDIDTTLPR